MATESKTLIHAAPLATGAGYLPECFELESRL